ncbi:arylesterase [Halomonas caseinilytica]|uniref:Acyl-CoA thioesterase-1 n=1 Tax=Halomonas caseinilytica TaxID=438744 RepID=A0A1M6RH61_9GAMM|nr:arylesterase [Halomonas caseinilytica]SHK31697.1 acyl-CoA thioesterase-1 [Halomonas caseinilytica]
MLQHSPVGRVRNPHWQPLRLVWLALVLCLVAGPVMAAPRPLILVMGDSLSAAYGIEREDGWVSLMADHLTGKARVVNASISGETTAGGKARLPELLRQHDPDIVLLELGGNDGLRGLPPSQMRANLAAMIEASQASGAEVALLGIDIPPNYGQAYREAFGDTFAALAKRYDIPLVPFLLDDVALQDGLMQDDGIHPTAAAQPQILDNVWPVLAALLETSGIDLASRPQ